MLSLSPLGGGVFLGWALGANDAANVFGTAVASRIIRFRNATILCSLAVLIGAVLQGQQGMHTLSNLTGQSIATVLITTISAAITVTVMTAFGLPVSTSQAIVGAITGIGLATGNMKWALLTKVVVCWIATPIGGMIFSVLIYYLIGYIFKRVPMSLLTRDKLLWGGLLLVGIYGSYSLGANNVANATGVFSGLIDGVSDTWLTVIGAASIMLGVITFSKRIMFSVGSGIMPLDAYTSFIAVFSMAITMHVFAMIGVPVSSSQAIVGSIVGIGLMRGVQSVHFGSLRNIGLGWLMTPAISLILAAAGYAIVSGLTSP